jgi:hypothetical protein
MLQRVALPLMRSIHGAVRVASFDRPSALPASQQGFPAGIICLEKQESGEREVLPLPPGLPDSYISGAGVSLLPPAPLLTLRMGLNASKTSHQLQPLFPAPDYLLSSPQNPWYPMSPAAWFPFSARAGGMLTHFMTVFHYGLFGTRKCFRCGGGALQPDATRLAGMYRMRAISPTNEGAFFGAVFVGSVVSYVDDEGKNEAQGVVMLPYVRLSSSNAEGLRKEVGVRAGDTSAVAALLASPVPVPMVLVLPLVEPTPLAAKQNPKQCWQLGTKSVMVGVRTACISRIWQWNELGDFGSLAPESSDARVKLVPPSAPLPPQAITPLRLTVTLPVNRRTVLAFIQQAEPFAADTTPFLRQVRQCSSLQYPIDTLLCSRARFSCAYKFGLPGVMAARRFAPLDESMSSSEGDDDGTFMPSAVGRKQLVSSPLPRAATASGGSLKTSASKSFAARLPLSGGSSAHATAAKATSKRRLASTSAPALDEQENNDGDNCVLEEQRQVANDDNSNAGDVPSRSSVNAHALFLTASDIFKAEHVAPLSAFIYHQEESKHGRALKGNKNEQAVRKLMLEWQNQVWTQLRSMDRTMYDLLEHIGSLPQHTTTAARLQHLLKVLTGPSWRKWVSTHVRGTKKSAQLHAEAAMVWAYTEGERPEARHGSVWQMHQRGCWYLKMPASSSAASTVTATASAVSSATSKLATKRAASTVSRSDRPHNDISTPSSSVFTSSKRARFADQPATAAQTKEASSESVSPPAARKARRGKTAAVLQVLTSPSLSALTADSASTDTAAAVAAATTTAAAATAAAAAAAATAAATAAAAATATAATAAAAAAASTGPLAPEDAVEVLRRQIATKKAELANQALVESLRAELDGLNAASTPQSASIHSSADAASRTLPSTGSGSGTQVPVDSASSTTTSIAAAALAAISCERKEPLPAQQSSTLPPQPTPSPDANSTPQWAMQLLQAQLAAHQQHEATLARFIVSQAAMQQDAHHRFLHQMQRQLMPPPPLPVASRPYELQNPDGTYTPVQAGYPGAGPALHDYSAPVLADLAQLPHGGHGRATVADSGGINPRRSQSATSIDNRPTAHSELMVHAGNATQFAPPPPVMNPVMAAALRQYLPFAL